MNQKIHFSGKVLCVERNSIRDTTLSLANCMVIYVDSSQCHKCRIDNLGDYNSLRSYCESENLNLRILFSPSVEDIPDVMEELMEVKYPFPIYLDYESVFPKMNRNIPSLRNFHAFLLDEDGYPIFVGDPIYSKTDKTFELLKRVVDKRKGDFGNSYSPD